MRLYYWSWWIRWFRSVTLYRYQPRHKGDKRDRKAGEIYNTVVYWSAVDSKVHLYSISSGKTIVGLVMEVDLLTDTYMKNTGLG